MTEQDRIVALETIFRNAFRRNDVVLTREMTAWDIPGWDSLMNMQIMLDVEKVFRFRFTVPEVANVRSVGDLIDIIGAKSKPHAPAKTQTS